MPGSIFGFPTRPTSGQQLIWSDGLGGRTDYGASSHPASSLTGLTLNRVPFGTSGGGLQDSANLTFDGSTLTLTGALTANGLVTWTNTTDASAIGTAAEVLSGGLSVAKKIMFGGTLTAKVNDGSTINLDLSDTAASRTVQMFRIVTSATAHTTVPIFDVITSGSTSSDLLLRYRANGTNVFTMSADGTAAASGLWSLTNATDASAIGTAGVVVSGGLSVAKKIMFGGTLTAKVNDGATINLDLVDTAASRSVAMFRVNTSATAHTTTALFDCVSAASTSSDKMVRVRANSVDVWTMAADGTGTWSGPQTFSNTVKIGTAAVASLPTGAAGMVYFATNGRKNGEGAGVGTGVLVFHDGTAWRACDTGATVAA